MKRILLFIFASMFAEQTWAYDFVYEGLCYSQININKSTAEVSKIDDRQYQATTITIPETAIWNLGLMEPSIKHSVVGIGRGAFFGCETLKSISIPNTITYIGDNAFSTCRALDSIVIPNSVKTIGKGAFESCRKLTSITIPSSVTSIGDHAFEGSNGLTSIIIESQADVSKADLHFTKDNIRYKVGNNGSVTVVSGEGMLPNSVGVPSYEGKIIIPSTIIVGDTFMVKGIASRAFTNCGDLETVTIPNSATYIGLEAFQGCINLKEVSIPESLTKIGMRAFDGCINLQYNEYDNALYLGNADNPYLGLISAKSKDITSCDINVNCKFIADYAFGGCDSLTTVIIPESVTNIGEDAFRCCSSLVSVSIPNSVSEIGRLAFYGCSSLVSVFIPNSVTKIGFRAFNNCSSLTIYSESSSKPKGWADEWNYDNNPVVWSFSGAVPGKSTFIDVTHHNVLNIFTHGNTIVVENATEEICVYDAMGRLICREAPCVRAELQVNGAGVYIVKVGTVAKRVMIND